MNHARRHLPQLLFATTLLLPACTGGGGGTTTTGPGGQAPRMAGTAVFLSSDHLHLMGVPDDASRSAMELSMAPLTGIEQFAVSPDGTAVAYIADAEVQARYELYVRRFDGTAALKVSVLANAFDDVFDFAWAPDSQSLAYRADAAVTGRAELFRVGRDGTNAYRVYQPVSHSVAVDDYLWSPDGHHLAFTLLQAGLRDALWLHDATTSGEGADLVLAVASGKQITDFAFAPASSQIAMRTDHAASTGQFEVFRAPTDLSSGVTRSNGTVLSSVQIGAWSWSADSRYLAEEVPAFPNASQRIGVNVFDTANDSSTRIVTTDAFGQITWSPQGHVLALCADFVPGSGPSGAQRLLRLDAATYDLSTLSNAMAAGEELRPDLFAWSPDGTRIAYVTTTNGFFAQRPYLVAVGGGAAAVPVLGTMGLEVTTLAWSGDGMHLGLLERDQTAAFHPGQWHLIGTSAMVTWSSGSVMTYQSSLTMHWTADDARAVYAVAASSATADELHAIGADGTGGAMLSSSDVDAAQVFELASGAVAQ